MEKRASGTEREGDSQQTSPSFGREGQNPFLFELSGEHPTLPRAEALSCVRAECDSFFHIASGPGYLVCSFSPNDVTPISDRIALTHRIGRYLGSCPPDQALEFASRLELPEGSIAVRVKKFQENFTEVNAGQLAAKLGGVLSKGRKVDLTHPEVEVRALLSDELHLFVNVAEIDRPSFEHRKVAKRPYFSPISLHPKYARALVNLTQVNRGQTLLDPFCGTGGILLEAATIGVKVVGSDISPEMVEGCKDNLEHFGLRWEEIRVVDIGDIEEAFGKVDAVATDPPYGRATSTMKEPLRELYARAIPAMGDVLRPGGSLGVVLPLPCAWEGPDLKRRETHLQRVHRSLTRHYCLFTRR